MSVSRAKRLRQLLAVVVRFRLAGALIDVLERAISLRMAKVSNVGGPRGGIHLVVLRKIFSLKRFAEKPPVMFFPPLSVGAGSDVVGMAGDENEGLRGLGLDCEAASNLSKNNLVRHFVCNLSKSDLISPILGSPGVGQKPFPKDRISNSSWEIERELRLTTLWGSGAVSVRTLVLKVLIKDVALSSLCGV